MYVPGHSMAGEGVVKPLTRGSIQPAGIDLSVHTIEELGAPGFLGVEKRVVPAGKPLEAHSGRYRLGPGAYRVRFAEIVSVPRWAVGFCYPRSSLLRMGATLSCAVWDPGYTGRGAALLAVYNPHGIVVEKGARVAQLVIARLETLPSELYRGVYLGEGL